MGTPLLSEKGEGGWQTVRVLVTGHDGYIGRVLTPVLRDRGHEVVGLDLGLFAGCALGPDVGAVTDLQLDLRDIRLVDLAGFDAVVHLAAISNDPLGELNADCTLAINHLASLRLATLAKAAGVERFLFASSCSLYGAAGPGTPVTETAPFNPLTVYGLSKVLAERDVAALADDRFSPTFLRNATVYGFSPQLRVDLVVNNLTGFAYLTGEVLILSDGSPWRPLVHVQDVARAFLAVLEARRGVVHNQAFNVGTDDANYQIRDVAEIVSGVVSGSRVAYAPDGGADERCYRVDFTKLHKTFPELAFEWDVRSGAEELLDAYQTHGLKLDTFIGPRFTRLLHIRESMQAGRLDEELRRTVPSVGT